MAGLADVDAIALPVADLSNSGSSSGLDGGRHGADRGRR
jgi:hypothetical protein